MKILRDIDAFQLIRALRVLGYESVRQDGSHIRLTTTLGGTHHLTIPNHRPAENRHAARRRLETCGRSPQTHRR